MSGFYRDGLRFACTRCGNCCSGSPGYVWISRKEQQAVADYLGLDLERFRKLYTRLVGSMISLIERPGGECIFLDAFMSCSIQPAKPRQCLSFPFWPRHLASAAAWEKTGRKCPGIGEGPLFSPEEIDAIQDRQISREVACRIFAAKRDEQ